MIKSSKNNQEFFSEYRSERTWELKYSKCHALGPFHPQRPQTGMSQAPMVVESTIHLMACIGHGLHRSKTAEETQEHHHSTLNLELTTGKLKSKDKDIPLYIFWTWKHHHTFQPRRNSFPGWLLNFCAIFFSNFIFVSVIFLLTRTIFSMTETRNNTWNWS